MPNDKVMIGSKEYRISKLRCRHLRRLDEVLASAKEAKDKGDQPRLYDTLNQWIPFIIDSIKANHPEFGQAEVDEMTMEEVLYVWGEIATYSSVRFTSGETKPTAQTGDSSTPASVAPPAGPIVN